MSKPEIKKVLVISTGHLTEFTNSVMVMEKGEIGLVYYPIEHGYVLILPPKITEWLKAEGWTAPRCIVDIVRRAKRLGCDWVRLDCDGEVLDGLTYYEW